MTKRKSNKYYFSTEGKTEKWYLEHLQKLINDRNDIPYKVDFDPKVNKSILSRAKTITAIYDVKAFHLCDYESNDEEHVGQFEKIIKELNEVKNINKNINYQLGYSNFTFELWIILHKKCQMKSLTSRNQYLNGINKAYSEEFLTLDEYKEEKNLKRILSKITIEDVITAVKNGDKIRDWNEKNAKENLRNFMGFEYYTENPDLTIHKCIKEILLECGIM